MTRGVTRTTMLTSLHCTDHDHSSNITFLLECLDNESLLVTIRNTSLGWKCDRRALHVSTAAVPILFVGRRTSSGVACAEGGVPEIRPDGSSESRGQEPCPARQRHAHAPGDVGRGEGEGDATGADQARGSQCVWAASRRPHYGSGIRGSLHA